MCSLAASLTLRTVRSMTSGEYLRYFFGTLFLKQRRLYKARGDSH
jgi:hypothetical protein